MNPSYYYANSNQQYSQPMQGNIADNYGNYAPSSHSVISGSSAMYGQQVGSPPAQAPTPVVQPPSHQQLISEVSSNMFFNAAPPDPGVLEILPLPSGSRHSSLIESPDMRNAVNNILARPSMSVVKNLTGALSRTNNSILPFKKSKRRDLIANGKAGFLPPQAQQSALEQHVLNMNPSVFKPKVAQPSVQASPGSSSNASIPHTAAPAYPPSVPSPEIPVSPTKSSSSSTKSKQENRAPVSGSSENAPSPVIPEQPPKLKISIKNSKPECSVVSDENAMSMHSRNAESPEFPELQPSRSQPLLTQNKGTPTKQISNLHDVKRESLTAQGDVFDASKLTMKLSSVDCSGCRIVFYDAMDLDTTYVRKSIAQEKKSTAGKAAASESHHAVSSFMKTCDRINQQVRKSDITHLVLGDPDVEISESDIPNEAILTTSLAATIAADAGKLRTHSQAGHVPFAMLKEVLVALLPTILSGYLIPADLVGFSHDSEDLDPQLYRDILNSRVIRGADAVTAALSIMTASKLPKEILNGDVIEACIRFARYQATHCIYPAYDPLYRFEASSKDGFVSRIKQKRARFGSTKDETMKKLYSRFEDIATLFAELTAMRGIEEAAMYQLASFGVSSFFVENIQDLALKALRLVSSIFSRYDKFRDTICDDILSSLGRLPSTKKNLRSYTIADSGEKVQMISALILHLIQSIARNPSKRNFSRGPDEFEVIILQSYEQSLECAKMILSAFFTKCATKGEEDYRPLFENFILDLLVMMNRPEWPAAECLLSLLASILLQKFNDKSVDAAFRYASIDSLGLIASRMRRNHLSVKESPEQLQAVVTKLYQAFETPDGTSGLEADTSEEPNELHLIQKGLIQFLHRKAPSPNYATTYYLVQWYNDVINGEMDFDGERSKIFGDMGEKTRDLVLGWMRKFAEHSSTSDFLGKDVVDSEMANLIARHFATKRSFARSFDSYFKRIITMATDATTQIRIRAIKCIGQIIDSDQSLMSREEVKSLVESRMWDTSATIRENVIEMIGKYALIDPIHITEYKMVLLRRLQDTAPSVRKKAIKVLHDIVIQYPENAICAEVCGNVIKRISDEETIRKLVYDVFQSLWFNPASWKDETTVVKRADQIIEVIDLLDKDVEQQTDIFLKMLKDFLKRPEEGAKVRKACKAIVDHIMERILEISAESDEVADAAATQSIRLSRCFQALTLFLRCCPDLGLPHVSSIPAYLSQPLVTKSDQKIVGLAAEILTLVVPLIRSPPDYLMARIEESCIALYTKPGVTIQLLQVNTECLAAVVNSATKNFKIVKDLYENCFLLLVGSIQKNPSKPAQPSQLQRAMCLVSLIVRYFDVDDPSFGYVEKASFKLVEILFALLKNESPQIRIRALHSLGFVFIRRPEIMMQKRVIEVYGGVLRPSNMNMEEKKTVLGNLLKYLQHEESQILTMEESSTAAEQYAQLDLRGNQNSAVELPRKIIYGFLKSILECGFDPKTEIRNEVLALITIIVQLRFSHPQQCIPFLISMGSDPSESISSRANALLEEINRRNPGTLSTKAFDGIKDSFAFRTSLCQSSRSVVRGFQLYQTGPVSFVGSVYSLLRTDRATRRNLILKMLEAFKLEDTPIEPLLYYADNLAYFSYQMLDEPLFVIRQIEPILAVISPEALNRFKSAIVPVPPDNAMENEEDDWETYENFKRMCPEDLTEIRQAYRSCQSSMILVALKRYLISYYAMTPAKLKEYAPNVPLKEWEKPIAARKTNAKYEPATAELLKTELKGETEKYLNAEFLVKKYFEFKEMVESVDERALAGEMEGYREGEDEDMEYSEVDLAALQEEQDEGTADAPSSSSVPSSPAKKRKHDEAFKKPRTPKKKKDPNAPKRPRGRPRKNPLPVPDESRNSSDEEY